MNITSKQFLYVFDSLYQLNCIIIDDKPHTITIVDNIVEIHQVIDNQSVYRLPLVHFLEICLRDDIQVIIPVI